VTLIQTCIASIPVYLLSFIKFPKWAIKTISTQMANCLLNDSEDKHIDGIWLIGKVLACAKEFGGVGIPNLRDLNTCLLGSWLRRYQKDDGKL
jgi:hypothetical protein